MPSPGRARREVSIEAPPARQHHQGRLAATQASVRRAPFTLATMSAQRWGSNSDEFAVTRVASHCRRRNSMAGPFIFIATNRLKTGKLEAERLRVPGLVDFIEANEPRLIAFNEYANDEGTEAGVVQVHPDADSFEFHMGVVRERAASAYEETLDATTSVHVFG